MRFGVSSRAVVVTGVLIGGLLAGPPAALALNPEGVADNSFSGDGIAEFPIGSSFFPVASALLPDGRLLVAASYNNGTSNQPVVVRLTVSGALDTTFGGGDGMANAGPADTGPEGMALGPDGRIAVVGSAADGVTGWVARINADGSPDTSFSGDGIASVAIPSFKVELIGITFDANGKIVVVGDRWLTGPDQTMLIARLTGAGALDTSFNTTGVKLDPALGYGDAMVVVPHPDGGVIYAGITNGDGTGDFSSWMGRLTAGGAFNAAFRTDGADVIDVGASNSFVEDLLVQPDGQLLLAARTNTEALLTRLDDTGTPDDSFGTNGIYLGDTVPANVDGVRIAEEPNGRIILVGATSINFFYNRLTPTGADDPTWSNGHQNAGSIASQYDTPVGVHVSPTGRIIVAINGQTDTSNELAAAAWIGDATKPFGARVFPGAVFATSSRSIRWTATDDNTGIKDFDVRYRSASATSSTLGAATTWKSNTTATSATLAVSAGKTYCVQARADDNAGNTSAYSPQACIAFPLDDRSLTRGGSWTSVAQSSSYKGTLSRSTSLNATLKKTGVQYRKLAVVATTCSGCGKVAVYLGSTKLATLDLNSSTTKRRVVFLVDTSTALKSGTVTIKQVSSGRPVFIDGLGVSLY